MSSKPHESLETVAGTSVTDSHSGIDCSCLCSEYLLHPAISFMQGERNFLSPQRCLTCLAHSYWIYVPFFIRTFLGLTSVVDVPSAWNVLIPNVSLIQSCFLFQEVGLNIFISCILSWNEDFFLLCSLIQLIFPHIILLHHASIYLPIYFQCKIYAHKSSCFCILLNWWVFGKMA